MVAGLGAAWCVSAHAYEFQLQFTPNYGARNLVVAGYTFDGSQVVGTCSYITVTGGGSGRGGGYHSTTTTYNQTCTWDLVGNLLGVTAGAPLAPAPLSSANGLTVYSRDAAGDVTGIDTSRGIGFVNTPSAQYAWLTKAGGYVFLANQNPVTIELKLQNVGDRPLVISKIEPVATLARVSVKATTCMKGMTKPGNGCAAFITYDPRGLAAGDNPYTAYDTLTVGIVSNSGVAPDFTESIEVPVSPGG